jgi:hypothetical protein
MEAPIRYHPTSMKQIRAGVAACLVAASLVRGLVAQEPAGKAVIERTGAHFRLVLHPDDLADELAATLADAALAKVEQLWPVAQKLTGAKARAVHEIHLYREVIDYRLVERAQSPWRFVCDAFVARDGIGHVTLTPRLDPALLAHIGLPQSTAEGLLWIAAQQVIAPCVAETDIAMWVEFALVIGAVEAVTNPTRAAGRDAAFDARRAAIAGWRNHTEGVSLARLVECADKQPDTAEKWRWFASSLAVVAQAMAVADARWASRLLEKHKLAKGQTGRPALQRAVAKKVFGKDWRAAERVFEQVMADTTPTWVVGAPLWQPGTPRSLLVGTATDVAGIELGAGHIPAGGFAIVGRLELGPRGKGVEPTVRFGFWTGDEMVANVAYQEMTAWIGVWEPKTERWDQKGQAVGFAGGRPFGFRIEVTADELRQVLDGEQVGTRRHGGRLACDRVTCEVNDRIVWIDELRIEPLAAK